jgi:hypothetical protein
MKKRNHILFIVVFLIITNSLFAIELNIEKYALSNTYITDFNDPAKYVLTITNNGESDNFEIFSLIGIDINPSEKIFIAYNETKNITVELIPQEALKSKKGYLNFEFNIKDSFGQLEKDTLTINIAGLEDVFEISAESIYPGSENIKVAIKNNVKYDFKELTLKLNSAFFQSENSFSLNSLEKKELLVPFDQERLKVLSAGDYLITSQIIATNKITSKDFKIRYLEKEEIVSDEKKSGIFIQRFEVSKTNTGNIKKQAIIIIEKDLLSYLFTTESIKPSEIKTIGLKKQLIFEKNLLPNEELRVVATTNWIYPVIIVILIALLLYFLSKYYKTDLVINKQVSYVKSKGGQFALKVSLKVKARKLIEKVNIIDKLPALVTLYEKYGAVCPDKVDLKAKRIEWDIETLNSGEERIFSYIIYSKQVGIFGRFELPYAKGIYEKDGIIKETVSNRAFYVNKIKRSKL